MSASEDFGSFGTEWHVPRPAFAPVLHPTLETGVQAVIAAGLDALTG